ncbi:MAG: 50S ribosomal protein L9 [Chloroflexi bacterium]|nr:MAG: 50S ribosomal protein L9 [Chloroflexota bacterium]
MTTSEILSRPPATGPEGWSGECEDRSRAELQTIHIHRWRRARDVRVMLTKDIDNVGKAGDIKEVADGYGRNFLFPRKLAVPALRGVETESKRLREAVSRRETKDRVEAQALADEIGNKTVVVRLKIGAEDKAFGSITNQDVAVALKAQHRVDIDRHKIDIREPIKTLGEHQVPLKLHRDVTAHVNLIVTQDR